MGNYKLMECSFPEMYSKGLYQEYNKDLGPNYTDKIADIFFSSSMELIGSTKSKDKPVALVFSKIDGTVTAAGIVQYFENDNPDNPGNWNFVWTFDGEDIPENAYQITFKDPQAFSYFRGYAGEKYGIRFKDQENYSAVIGYFPICLKKWLDENAKEGEQVSVELPDVFVAKVEVVDGKKQFGLEVSGATTFQAKGDQDIEK